MTTVFKSLETGLRQGTIFPNDLYRALTRLGLNPTEQEIVDIANYIAKFDIQFDVEEMVTEPVYRILTILQCLRSFWYHVKEKYSIHFL